MYPALQDVAAPLVEEQAATPTLHGVQLVCTLPSGDQVRAAQAEQAPLFVT